MSANIEELLPPSVLENYKAHARARGMSLADFLRDHLIQNAPPIPSGPARILTDSFDGFPDLGPVFEEGMERVSWFC